jgi:hypothetical protein
MCVCLQIRNFEFWFLFLNVLVKALTGILSHVISGDDIFYWVCTRGRLVVLSMFLISLDIFPRCPLFAKRLALFLLMLLLLLDFYLYGLKGIYVYNKTEYCIIKLGSDCFNVTMYELNFSTSWNVLVFCSKLRSEWSALATLTLFSCAPVLPPLQESAQN